MLISLRMTLQNVARLHSKLTGSPTSALCRLVINELPLSRVCNNNTSHPWQETDQSAGNIDNWLQQVTEENGARPEDKKQREVQDTDITPGCDVQTEPICSRK